MIFVYRICKCVRVYENHGNHHVALRCLIAMTVAPRHPSARTGTTIRNMIHVSKKVKREDYFGYYTSKSLIVNMCKYIYNGELKNIQNTSILLQLGTTRILQLYRKYYIQLTNMCNIIV